jgi:hypothetical protein
MSRSEQRYRSVGPARRGHHLDVALGQFRGQRPKGLGRVALVVVVDHDIHVRNLAGCDFDDPVDPEAASLVLWTLDAIF